MSQLHLQRYRGRPGHPHRTAGQWLVAGVGLLLRRYRGQHAGWGIEPCVWLYNDQARPGQTDYSQSWLEAVGLEGARFPTRRAVLGEVQRLHQLHPLQLHAREEWE